MKKRLNKGKWVQVQPTNIRPQKRERKKKKGEKEEKGKKEKQKR